MREQASALFVVIELIQFIIIVKGNDGLWITESVRHNLLQTNKLRLTPDVGNMLDQLTARRQGIAWADDRVEYGPDRKPIMSNRLWLRNILSRHATDSLPQLNSQVS